MNSDSFSNSFSFEELSSSIFRLNQDIETVRQELYEVNQNIKIIESTNKDYKQEIDATKEDEIKLTTKFEKYIKDLDQKIFDTNQKNMEVRIAFEEAIKGMQEKNKTLRREVDTFKGNESIQDTTSLINDFLSESLSKKEEVYLELEEAKLRETNEYLTSQYQEFTSELENLKECYESKYNQVLELKKNNQLVTDEIVSTKKNIADLKSQPLNKNSKGNSLFAEVHDRKVYLENKITEMKNSYVSICQEINTLRKTITYLKNENLKNFEKWKSEIYETEIKDGSQYSGIQEMEDAHEQNFKNLEEKQIVKYELGQDGAIFISVMLNEPRNILKELREQLWQKCKEQMLFLNNLMAIRDENRKLRIEAMIIEKQTDLFKNVIESKSFLEAIEDKSYVSRESNNHKY